MLPDPDDGLTPFQRNMVDEGLVDTDPDDTQTGGDEPCADPTHRYCFCPISTDPPICTCPSDGEMIVGVDPRCPEHRGF